MTWKLCTQIILSIVYVITLVHFLRSSHKIQQSLQWWSSRQSMKLFMEAEKIRDGLLQESFIIRRSLDLLAVEHLNLSPKKTQDCLTKIDNFHHALAKLSDRLFPESLQDSFPLAIECLLEPWLTSHPHRDFHFDLPASWRREPAERSMIVLLSLEELLKLTLPELLIPISIYISLKQQKDVAQLIVQISYPDVSTLGFYSHLPELNYLCESFRILTSGKCFCRSKNLNAAWYFFW
ncbi:MAG: hypothetical protein AB3A66_12655 [Nodularia sp. CChRGM 3473]